MGLSWPNGGVLTPSLRRVDKSGHLPIASDLLRRLRGGLPDEDSAAEMMRHCARSEFERPLNSGRTAFRAPFWDLFRQATALYILGGDLAIPLMRPSVAECFGWCAALCRRAGHAHGCGRAREPYLSMLAIGATARRSSRMRA